MTIGEQMIMDTDRPKIIGVNRRHFPTQVGTVRTIAEDIALGAVEDWSSMPPCTTAVLVLGDIGDYACYVGHGSDEWVARHGDKISFEEACCHFPGGQLKRELYRS